MQCYFLDNWLWLLPWIKFNEWDVIIHVTASQLSGHCDVHSNRSWRHQQNVNRTSQTQGRCATIVVVMYDSLSVCCICCIRHIWQYPKKEMQPMESHFTTTNKDICPYLENIETTLCNIRNNLLFLIPSPPWHDHSLIQNCWQILICKQHNLLRLLTHVYHFPSLICHHHDKMSV